MICKSMFVMLMINALVELSQKPWLTGNLTIHIPFMSPIKEYFCNGLFLVILLKYHRELIKYWNRTWTIFLRQQRVRSSLQQYSYFRKSYTLIQGSFKSDMMQQCFKKIYHFTCTLPSYGNILCMLLYISWKIL